MGVNKYKDKDNWPSYVGKAVEKHSGKPFKSGLLSGVVVSYTTNPHSGKPGFLMNDGSVVDCHQVKLVDDTFAKVKKILVEFLLVGEDEIVDDANITVDLAADALDIIEVVIELEKEFGIKIYDEDLDEVTYVHDLVRLVEKSPKKVSEEQSSNGLIEQYRIPSEPEVVDNNKSLIERIKNCKDSLTSEEWKELIELGESYKTGLEAEEWWDKAKIDEKKYLFNRYKGYVEAENINELSKSDIIKLYEIDYGD